MSRGEIGDRDYRYSGEKFASKTSGPRTDGWGRFSRLPGEIAPIPEGGSSDARGRSDRCRGEEKGPQVPEPIPLSRSQLLKTEQITEQQQDVLKVVAIRSRTKPE